MKIFCFIVTVVFFFACYNNAFDSKKKNINNERKVIISFQPIQRFPVSLITWLKDSIEQFYPVAVVIMTDKNFPANCYYAPNNRYRADTALGWLKLFKPDTARLIVGLTEKDISTSKNEIIDYGVFGLGLQPGESCIISTYRLNNKLSLYNSLKQRLFKVVAHEIGHNLGLKHCTDKACIMRDAKGKMVLDEEKDLCNSCRHNLLF